MPGVGQEVEPIIDLDFDAHMAAVDKAAPAEDIKADLEPVAEPIAIDEPPPVEKPKEPARLVVAAKPEEEITDPDTGDKIDLRTREGKRIQRLLERTKRAESETARLRSATPAPPAKPVEEKKASHELTAPNPADFTGPDAVDKYIDAKVDYKLQVALAADRAARQAEVQQREATELATKIHAREAAFVKEHGDYYQAIEAAELIEQLGAGVAIFKSRTAEAILDTLNNHEDGPAIAYFLAKHPQEHARVATLSPSQALLELGKLLHMESAPPTEKEKPKEEKRSSAPPPPDVVEGRASATDPDPMARDFDTHVAIGNREDAQRSRARRRSAA